MNKILFFVFFCLSGIANAAPKVIIENPGEINFDGLSLEGELKAPGEFYFQNRNQERFDSLTKRRIHFHREMLRDSVQTH